MQSFTAGHISSPEAAELIKTAQEKLGNDRWQFYPGVSYRNLLVYRGSGRPAPFSPDTRTTPPHDLTDKSVLDDYPRGPGSDILTHLMTESEELFADHPVNVARRAAGKPPATNIWLWGLGSTPSLTPFAELYGKQGAMITAVDLLRGLATLIGWKRIEVPGATGYIDTDYAAKGRYAVDALKDVDLVCVHVEATDEASHEGNAAAKVKGPGRNRPAHRRPGPRGLENLRRVSHSGIARPSHAAAHKNPQPRLCAIRLGRFGRHARCRHNLR